MFVLCALCEDVNKVSFHLRAIAGMGPGPHDKDAIITSIKTDLLKVSLLLFIIQGLSCILSAKQ